MKQLQFLWLWTITCSSFQPNWKWFHPFQTQRRTSFRLFQETSSRKDDINEKSPLSITNRLPTSIEDQVRQCIQSIQGTSSLALASSSSDQENTLIRRHVIRLLLPIIGATDLDDWPGGTRQMMEAAAPMVEQIMIGLGIPFSTNAATIQKQCLDSSDGVYAWIGQANEAKDDCVFVLLPTAECIPAIRQLEEQVGPKRNLILVNPQWRRRTDFGSSTFGWGGGMNNERDVHYVEQYQPTFSLTNMICEGESIRILHNYNNPSWKVYIREELPNGDIDWKLLGEKPFVTQPTVEWKNDPMNKRDGGRLFDYGQPSYQDIIHMLNQSPNYKPKNPAERAAAAFTFIKDTL